jgi:CHAT domain-containing protein
MENYNIYRLSSTRELVTSKKIEKKNLAVLYGGLDYDARFDKSATGKNPTMQDEVFKERANVRGMGLRGGKEYLKHTKEEVDIIGEELDKVNWECLIDSASMGTEESFKALSGREIGCLHISTHGFYYTKEDADNARYKFMLIDNNMVSDEDRTLTRSGLVMSGANHILEDEVLPVNVEDGILTAKEIADIDLRGLDLVVLSACQTGLGDIAQGEGVFGLQRGFKKAGANSILMSLWEVEDKATQILMTQFYRNLLSGQSKRQSLLSAQKYLREVGGGRYDEPKYWAAFILLDGTN